MARFNQPIEKKNLTDNIARGQAYKETPKLERDDFEYKESCS